MTMTKTGPLFNKAAVDEGLQNGIIHISLASIFGTSGNSADPDRTPKNARLISYSNG